MFATAVKSDSSLVVNTNRGGQAACKMGSTKIPWFLDITIDMCF